jgi:hypothetical protein
VKLNKMIGLVDGRTAPRVLMGLLMLATTAEAQTDDAVVTRFVGKWEGEISNAAPGRALFARPLRLWTT